jgi:hypothetical protein
LIVLVRSSCSLRAWVILFGLSFGLRLPCAGVSCGEVGRGPLADQFVLCFGQALQECGNRTGRPAASYRCPRSASGTRRRAAAALGELDQPHIVRPRRSRRHTIRQSPPGSAAARRRARPVIPTAARLVFKEVVRAGRGESVALHRGSDHASIQRLCDSADVRPFEQKAVRGGRRNAFVKLVRHLSRMDARRLNEELALDLLKRDGIAVIWLLDLTAAKAH